MTAELLKQLIDGFQKYVEQFRSGGVLHPMHQLKLEHTIRVAADCRTIAIRSGFSDSDVHLAEAIGLFHDIARFPQFHQYHSFSDAETVDHGDLGVLTLEKEQLLDGVAEESRALILKAVQYHNKKELPDRLSDRQEQYLRLIRDADRLDIFFICWDTIRTGHIHDHPEIIMNIDFNGPPSQAVLDQFARGGKIDYRSMNSMADRFILQLSWMQDLSYVATKQLVCERDIINQFIEVLPVKTDALLDCFKMTALSLEPKSGS